MWLKAPRYPGQVYTKWSNNQMNAINEDQIRRYLLGGLGEKEMAQLEKNMLADDDFFEQILIAENELIDDYVRGGLSSHDRESFGSHFLSSSERRQKLKFAESLYRHLDRATDWVVDEWKFPQPQPEAGNSSGRNDRQSGLRLLRSIFARLTTR
ncbi:MAG TPA: hypothetical protein VFD58_12640 [Blastocatellia bacterium]|nr:hypothetical protein [Blastocatellia bacterium]